MVVVPTDTHVELSYGRAPVELVAAAMSLLGVVGLVFLIRSGPLTDRRRVERGAHSPEPEPEPASDQEPEPEIDA
jgi:hypothetical protein